MDKIARMIDANFNRGREGLRVVEDVIRFVLDDADLSSRIKAVRHEVTSLVKQLPLGESELLDARDSQGDVGANSSITSENSRVDLMQIVIANFRRAQEAMRVLEEMSKLYDANIAAQFKGLRFRIYGLEKDTLPKLIQHYNRCG